MAQIKKAKFYCENCGAEVPQDAKFCKHCGRFFANVRCPACGYTGHASEFSNGCPKCGYALSHNLPQKNNKNFNDKPTRTDDPLPFWMYIIAVGILAALVCLCIQYAK